MKFEQFPLPKYHTSDHFRDNPRDEVDAALVANSVDSVRGTLRGRMTVELWHRDPDIEAIERVQQQLAHLAAVVSQAEVEIQPAEIPAAA